MTTLLLLILVAAGFFIVERLWPANQLPKVRGWWARIALVNLTQLGILMLAGQTWDRWMQRASLFHLGERLGDVPAAIVAYLVSCFVYYWWHRIRHESTWFWRFCHQLHHSPRRIELLTSFYKHPVEITINSILSSAIAYLIVGCSLRGAALYTFLIAVAEYRPAAQPLVPRSCQLPDPNESRSSSFPAIGPGGTLVRALFEV